jgi:hypothetical protein
MGWHKRQHTALDEPKNPTTLADMIHEGLSFFAGATAAAITALLIRCRW